MEFEKFRERLEMLGFSMEDGGQGIINIYSPLREKVIVVLTRDANNQALNLPHNGGVVLSPDAREEIFDLVLEYTKRLLDAREEKKLKENKNEV